MINIIYKQDCCGCSACAQRCPKQCISMIEDEEGFLYPKVDTANCIDCHLCEKVCPVINQDEKREPLASYAAKNPDEKIRMNSSSGGIFSMLAERIIQNNGVVFGAIFNERWEVVHDYVETKEDLAKFRGSKYVQSKIGNNYQKAKAFLDGGRIVLFSGTPCQISGLKKYLRKDYDNLLSIDFICHGVPSPGVFRTYLQEEIDKESARQGGGGKTVLHPCIPLITESDGLDYKGMEIKSIAFRDKRNGWKKFGFALSLSKASAAGEKNSVSLSYKPLNENIFLRGFLCDLYLRPSCYACPDKELKSGSDITIGDYWGIDTLLPEIDDDKGVSAVTINTSKGKEVLSDINVELYELPYPELVKRNPALVKSCAIPLKRKDFFTANDRSFEQKIKILTKTPFSIRLLLSRIVRKVMPSFVVTYIRELF